jgi:hypothetical protein
MSERGTTFGREVVEMTDQITGAFVMQLTSAPNFSNNLYFEHQSFLCDDKTLLFISQRTPGRGVPWDLFRVDIDGRNLTQLTDEKHPLGHPIPSWDKRIIYGFRQNVLLGLNPDTFEETEIACFDEAAGFGACTLSGDDKYFIAVASMKDGTSAVVRLATDGTDVTVMCHGLPFNHIVANPGKPEFTFSGKGSPEYPQGVMVCNNDGTNLRRFVFQRFAHCAWLGRTGRMQGTLVPPGHAIMSIASDEKEPQLIASGPYFWHSAASQDAKWIVADTNWPDMGIHLIHVESGRFACLCKSLGSNGDWTHPHPSFNRAGTQVVYNSDKTGVPQIYLVTIPDTIRNEVENGNLTHRQRWPGQVI